MRTKRRMLFASTPQSAASSFAVIFVDSLIIASLRCGAALCDATSGYQSACTNRNAYDDDSVTKCCNILRLHAPRRCASAACMHMHALRRMIMHPPSTPPAACRAEPYAEQSALPLRGAAGAATVGMLLGGSPRQLPSERSTELSTGANVRPTRGNDPRNLPPERSPAAGGTGLGRGRGTSQAPSRLRSGFIHHHRLGTRSELLQRSERSY